MARNLTVAEGSNVNTNSFNLTLSGNLIVTDLNSDVFIETGGTLDADEVFIQNSAEIEVSGGSLIADRVEIDAGTQLETTGGTTAVNVSQLLINNGQIDTLNGGVINFASAADFAWDLDGTSESGVVDASDGNLNFTTGGLDDAFDGTMRVGAGRVLTIAEDWTNASGVIDLNGGSDFDSRARLNGALGGTLINFFSGSVQASGRAHIDAEVIFFGGILPNQTDVSLDADASLDFNRDATIAGGEFTLANSADMRFNDDTTLSGGVFDIGQDATVFFKGNTTVTGGTFNTVNAQLTDGYAIFEGATTYNGGTVTVNGLLLQEGDATVAAPTTVNAEVFDMDGAEILTVNLTESTWTVNDALTVNADRIDETDNVFHDHITINHAPGAGTAGKLIINLPGDDAWTISPTSDLNVTGRGGIGFSSVIEGADVNIQGATDVTNRVSLTARADLSGTVNINADSNLRLLGGSIDDPNTLDGATISGDGTLSTINDRALVGHGQIATDVTFINQAQLRADNGELVVSGTINDVGVIGTADTDGTLNVTNAWNTDVANRVELRGGSIIGASITNDGANGIRGFGTLAPTNLNNNSVITAAGDGVLIIDPNNAPDLDGTTENGRIEAINGNLTVVDELLEFFDGTAEAGAQRILRFEQGWRLGDDGDLVLTGGPTPSDFTSVAGTEQHLHGRVSVTGSAFFNIDTVFKPTAVVTLPNTFDDALFLTRPTTIEAGATFTGDGRVVNFVNNTLTLADGATVGVQVPNQGTLLIGGSPGIATVAAFSQPQGVLEIELAGVTPGTQHDLLNVVGEASLGGALDVALIDGFTPQVGDAFTVLSADTLSGAFETYTGDVFSFDTHLALAPVIDAPAAVVELVATYPGDANLDFMVDAADLNTIALNWQQTGKDWLDGDFSGDGAVDAADLNLLALNWQFGQSLGALASFDAAWSAALAASVPEPTTLGLFTLAGLAMLKRPDHQRATR